MPFPDERPLDPLVLELCQALAMIASVSRPLADKVVQLLVRFRVAPAPLLRELMELAQDSNRATLLGITEDELFELYRRAYHWHREGEHGRALDLLEALLVLTPGHSSILGLMSACHLELGHLGDALSYADLVLATDQGDAEDKVLRGAILYRMGELEQAAEALRLALSGEAQALDENSVFVARAMLREIGELLGDAPPSTQ